MRRATVGRITLGDDVIVGTNATFANDNGRLTRLNGREILFYRAIYLLRVMAIPPRIHKLEIRYRPPSFIGGHRFVSGALIILILRYEFSRRKS